MAQVVTPATKRAMAQQRFDQPVKCESSSSNLGESPTRPGTDSQATHQPLEITSWGHAETAGNVKQRSHCANRIEFVGNWISERLIKLKPFVFGIYSVELTQPIPSDVPRIPEALRNMETGLRPWCAFLSSVFQYTFNF